MSSGVRINSDNDATALTRKDVLSERQVGDGVSTLPGLLAPTKVGESVTTIMRIAPITAWPL